MTEPLEPDFEGGVTFARETPFRLAGGGKLRPVTQRYAVYGELDDARSNAILVCHALSGSARAADWWPEIVGPGLALDTTRYAVICINALGSCYGSTGSASANPRTGEHFGPDFPVVAVRDIVRAQAAVLDHLGITRLRAVVGGSIGGMQAVQWAVDFPERVGACVAIAACPLPPLGLALNHLQRQAIRNDPAWTGGRYDEQPRAGLALARSIAMCSYKSADLFDERFGRRPNRGGENPYRSLDERYDVAGYLDRQGEAFVERFDANALLVLSRAMDTFDPGFGYASEAEALSRVTAPTTLVGIATDWLFPPSDVEAFAERLRAAGAPAAYASLASTHGHDGFLADAADVAPLVASAIAPGPVRLARPNLRACGGL